MGFFHNYFSFNRIENSQYDCYIGNERTKSTTDEAKHKFDVVGWFESIHFSQTQLNLKFINS